MKIKEANHDAGVSGWCTLNACFVIRYIWQNWFCKSFIVIVISRLL